MRIGRIDGRFNHLGRLGHLDRNVPISERHPCVHVADGTQTRHQTEMSDLDTTTLQRTRHHKHR